MTSLQLYDSSKLKRKPDNSSIAYAGCYFKPYVAFSRHEKNFVIHTSSVTHIQLQKGAAY